LTKVEVGVIVAAPNPPGHVTDTVLAPNETFLTLGNEGVVAIAWIVV
jgi:hypothetical protein